VYLKLTFVYSPKHRRDLPKWAKNRPVMWLIGSRGDVPENAAHLDLVGHVVLGT